MAMHGPTHLPLRKWVLKILTSAVLCLSFVQPGLAATWYVAINGNDAAAGTSWATAKKTIQSAIDLAAPNDTVLVSNGVYAAGGRVVYGALTNRVAITKQITVRSVNGLEFTAIQGAKDPLTINGDAAVRCVYVGTNALLSGFTLANGATRNAGDYTMEQRGGGAWCESSGVISNCMFTGNSAYDSGGGSYGGTLNNCMLTGNSASGLSGGGGSYGGTLNNCLLTGNSAGAYGGGSSDATLNRCTLTGNWAGKGGGGSCNGTLNNCTLTDNSASGSSGGGGSYGGTLNNCTLTGNSVGAYGGGGSDGGTLNNCIVYFNQGIEGSNYCDSTFNYSCTTPDPGGTGNITNDPQFINRSNGNFHLSFGSPCINKGNNAFASGTTDFDGNPRIVGGTVDIGAYEYQVIGPSGYDAWIAAITNGLTNYNQCATGDGYPNLLKYATGSSPTNSDTLARLSAVFRDTQSFVAVFMRNTNAYDVTIIVEASNAASNGSPWKGIATNFAGSWGNAPNVLEAGTTNPVSVNVVDTTPTTTKRFLRLRVTRP